MESATIFPNPAAPPAKPASEARDVPSILPKDIYDAAAANAASALEAHSEQTVRGLEDLMGELLLVQDRLKRESRESRAMIERHTNTMRTAHELTSMIRKAIRAEEESL